MTRFYGRGRGAVPRKMAKRARKVAFADEVQVEDKRRREEEAEEQAEGEDEERSECA